MTQSFNLLMQTLGYWFYLLLLWSLVWKGLALWRAARMSHKVWFIILLILNTAGIAEIIYLIATNEEYKQKFPKK